ncbi:MAG: exodeoxyribonuclease III [Deltaproteobacteria bacterium]|nr:MAG: exodeoxyribonuclease III [Deltaproteobacteria bacterium]
MGTFKIATYNVNSIRSRLHIIIPWLQENRPAVLCMQETKVEDEKFPVKEFGEIGYHVIFKGQKRYNGVAVASQHKPQEVSFGLDDGGPADEDRLIKGVFSGVAVLNTYVPQGYDRQSPQFEYKLQWFKRLRDFIARHYRPAEPLVWCGDLNVAPEEIDVHNPKRLLGHVCFTPEVWEAFALVKSWGFVDMFRKHHPGEPGQYTFYDYRVPKAVERGLGWRVDHILATPALADRSKSCYIDMGPRLAEKPSDHTILVAEFEI